MSNMNILSPSYSYCLDSLVSHDCPDTGTGSTGVTVVDRRRKDSVFTGKTYRCNLRLFLPEFFAKNGGSIMGTLTGKV